MPNIIELKANFAKESSENKPGAAELPANASVSIAHLISLMDDVKNVKVYWDMIKKKHKRLPNKIIIEAHYIKTIPKSRRVDKLIVFPNRSSTGNDIIGARFTKDGDNCHIVSYALPYDALDQTIIHLRKCIEYMQHKKISEFTTESLHHFNEDKGSVDINVLKAHSLTKSKFSRTLVDAYYVHKLDRPEEFKVSDDPRIITLFEIDDINVLLKLAGLDREHLRPLKNSLLLPSRLQAVLHDNAPYLVCMSIPDFATTPILEQVEENDCQPMIPDPDGEPVIGVIDTQFKDDVYFHRWVEYVDVMNGAIQYTDEDYAHGTAVSSIIVDGPSLNSKLDDNCGRFRVKHFGAGTKGNISIYTIASEIENWVRENPDIHVWNISLGTESETEKNSVSFLAAVLDDIQSSYNVIFAIAGTNDNTGTLSKRIGSPADSINSVVVSSVNSRGEKPSYARKGPILSFFMKPDVCTFGGDNNDEMMAYGFVGSRPVHGTSFAAPWIARKLAFLIDKMGLPIPVAKAMIIDSAVTWDNDATKKEHDYYGYGVVPIRIEEILTAKRDEIKFYLNVDINSYHTYLYDIPVPLVGGKFPFIAKATLCYMSTCSRNCGVDYTDTELDFKFGRVRANGKIESINDDKQYEKEHFTCEEDSRKFFRKWDNVKNIVQELKPKLHDKARFSDQLWGIDIKMASRNSAKKQEHVKVGIVVTLKEIHGVNRYNSFVRNCRLRHFIVNELDIENRIALDNTLRQDIDISS